MIPILIVDLGNFNFILWVVGALVVVWIILFLLRFVTALANLLAPLARGILGVILGFLGL